MKKLTLEQARALALRNGGTLEVGNKPFNTSGVVARPARREPPAPEPTPAPPPLAPDIAEISLAVADALAAAIGKLVPQPAPEIAPAPTLSDVASARAKTLSTLTLDVKRDDSNRIEAVSVFRNGDLCYIVSPVPEPSGLINRLVVEPVHGMY